MGPLEAVWGHVRPSEPHPDDAELWAGGTLACHTHAEGGVIIAIVKHDPVRKAEADDGADILYLLNDINTHAIGTLLTEVRPDVAITAGTPAY